MHDGTRLWNETLLREMPTLMTGVSAKAEKRRLR
jgi:hypothetical protein